MGDNQRKFNPATQELKKTRKCAYQYQYKLRLETRQVKCRLSKEDTIVFFFPVQGISCHRKLNDAFSHKNFKEKQSTFKCGKNFNSQNAL